MANKWGPSDDSRELAVDTEHGANVVTAYYEDEAQVKVGFDPYGPVGGKDFVEVVGPDYYLSRNFYFTEADQDLIGDFAERIVADPRFRERSLDGRAPWCHVAGIYDEASERIRVVFEEKGLLSYRAGNDRAERRHREARERMETFCRAVFEEIDEQVRHEALIVGLDTFVDDCVERAREAAEEISHGEPP